MRITLLVVLASVSIPVWAQSGLSPATAPTSTSQPATASAPSGPNPSCSAYKIHLAYFGTSAPSGTQRYVTKLDAIVGGLTADQKKAIVGIIEAANEENRAWKKANAGKEDQFPEGKYVTKMPEPLAKIGEKRDASIAAVLTEKQHLAFGRSQLVGHLRTNFAYNHKLTADDIETIEAEADRVIAEMKREGKLPVQYLRMVPPMDKMRTEMRERYIANGPADQAQASAPTTAGAAQTQVAAASAPTSRPGEIVDVWINYDSPFVHGSLYTARMSPPDTVTLTLIGRDDGWKWYFLPGRKIQWKASPEVEVAPVSGAVVTARIVRAIERQAWVSAETKSDDGRDLRVFFYIAPKKQ